MPAERPSPVRDMPALWDLGFEAYKDKYHRDICWSRICRNLYPEFDSYTSSLQSQISKDVKQRWRSIRDRFHKIKTDTNKSGSSPAKINFPFYEELHFLISNKSSRSTEGNISAPDTEDTNNQEDAGNSDSSSVGSSLTVSGGHNSSVGAGRPPSPSSGKRLPSDPQSNATPGTQKSANPVALKEPPTKKKQTKKDSDTDKKVADTLTLIQKSTREDYLDLFGSTVATKARSMPLDRQTTFIASVYAMVVAFEDPSPIAHLNDIVVGISNSVRAKPQPPPPREHDQRYQRPPSTFYHCDSNTSQRPGPPPNGSNLDSGPNYAYCPEYNFLN